MAVKKILLVDDSQPFNFLSRITLQQAIPQCTIDEALNGKSALDYIGRSSDCPDVILLDLNMPVMDGFEFLKEFEKKGKCTGMTKIFILTSSQREEDRETALSNKFVRGYLSKPLSPPQIEQILAT
jgi:CheY-like chemotaxis protein